MRRRVKPKNVYAQSLRNVGFRVVKSKKVYNRKAKHKKGNKSHEQSHSLQG